jgi:pyridoxal biosynthesis lyase PdxS
MAFRPALGAGLQAAVFTRNRETVVAFRGTSQATDVVADLKIGLGMNTSMFSEAEDFVARRAPGDGVVVTGHSLGGAIAQTVGNRRRLPFVSFNAPGVALLASQNLGSVMPVLGAVRLVVGATVGAIRHPMQTMRDVGAAFHDSLGVNYRLSGDLVSAYGLHYGPIVHLQGQGDPLTQHRMTTMNAVLDRFGYGNIGFPV